MSNEFAVPLRVGDKVTARYIDGEMLVHEELTVTEVCSKGFFVSAHGEGNTDPGEYIPYSKLGTSYFLDGKLWAKRAGGVDNE